MATMTLADLVEQVGDEIGRDGDEEAIRWAIERTTDRANRLLRTRWMLCRATRPVAAAVADGDEYLTLSDEFAGMTEARFIDTATGDGYDLIYVSHKEAADRFQEAASGLPNYYSIYENQIRLLPPADRAGTLEMWIYERFGLEDDADTNWLLKYHRDIYINGAAVFMKRRLGEPLSEIKDYETAFLRGISEIMDARAAESGGGERGEPAEYF